MGNEEIRIPVQNDQFPNLLCFQSVFISNTNLDLGVSSWYKRTGIAASDLFNVDMTLT